jgi:hypothetical protein
VEAGFAKAGGGKNYDRFDVAPSVPVVLGDDVDACRAAVKPFLALYVGGMGAKGRNFYFDLVARYGFGDTADEVQRLYLSGRKDEAAAAIPDGLVDQVALCGPKARIAEGLERWKAAPINTLIINTFDPQVVRVMAELVLGADAGQPERTVSLPPVSPQPASPEVPPPTPEPASAPVAKSAVVFERMAERIAQNPALVDRVGAIYQFRISGEPGGDWVVDLKNAPGAVRAGAIDKADCTIAMNDNDFYDLASGKLNGMAAFSSGKLKVQGNIMLATKLQSLFS